MALGLHHAAAVPYAVAPEATGRAAARAAARFFLQQGERAPDSDGALFAPRPLRAAVHGAWGLAERRKAGGAGMVLLGAVALAAGAVSWLFSAGRRNGRERERLGTGS